MINIRKNIAQNITTDDFLPISVWVFKHTLSGDYFVFLCTSYYTVSGRYTELRIIDGVDYVADEMATIGRDVIDVDAIYMFQSEQGVIRANLPVGEYGVYIYNTGFIGLTDEFIEDLKININTINQLTEDNDYSLYLRYRPTLANVKNS